MTRPYTIVVIRVPLEKREVVGDPDERPGVARERNDGASTKDGVDGAPFKAEVAEI